MDAKTDFSKRSFREDLNGGFGPGSTESASIDEKMESNMKIWILKCILSFSGSERARYSSEFIAFELITRSSTKAELEINWSSLIWSKSFCLWVKSKGKIWWSVGFLGPDKSIFCAAFSKRGPGRFIWGRHIQDSATDGFGNDASFSSWTNLLCNEGSKSEMGQGEKHSWRTISSLILYNRLHTALCMKRTELDPPWLAHKKANSRFL